jgi:S-(hydroxymethyl)glutathione dehydrogenase/alcohol dehydrogenase
MGCSITTAFGLINNEAKLKIGQRVMVIGCGGVGLNIIQAAKLVGAGLIIGVESCSSKANKIREMGATYSSSIPDHDLNIDIVIDTTGISTIIEQGWEITKEKMILVGQPHYKESFTFRNARDTFFSGKVMMDSQGGLTDPNIDIPRYLDMGDKIINENVFYSLDKINEAIEDMNKGLINKPMLEMR